MVLYLPCNNVPTRIWRFVHTKKCNLEITTIIGPMKQLLNFLPSTPKQVFRYFIRLRSSPWTGSYTKFRCLSLQGISPRVIVCSNLVFLEQKDPALLKERAYRWRKLDNMFRNDATLSVTSNMIFWRKSTFNKIITGGGYTAVNCGMLF